MYVKYLSVNCHIFNSDQTLAINEFRESILRQIDNLSSNGADVIVIYIPNEYEIFTMQDNYDLHDIVKAYAAQKKYRNVIYYRSSSVSCPKFITSNLRLLI